MFEAITGNHNTDIPTVSVMCEAESREEMEIASVDNCHAAMDYI